MNLVCDHMSAPAMTVRTNTPMTEIFGIFQRGVFAGLPVVDEDGHLAGIVSTTDVVRRLTKPIDERLTAAKLMSSPAITATPSEGLDAAAWRLVAARAHRLVVVENERPIGVLSATDILGGLMHRHVNDPLRAIMASPVETVLLGAPISEAVARLVDTGVHGLVVLDVEKPVGIFDQTQALASRRLPPSLLEDPVEELMCHEFVSLEGSTSIHRAARIAWSRRAQRILVTEQKRLVGVVSEVDLVDALARSAEEAVAS